MVDPLDRRRGPHGDAVGGEDLGKQLPGFGLLDGHEPLERLQDRHLRAETSEHVGELGAHGTAAHDGQRFG